MAEFVTALIGVLLATTVAASVEYYRQIRKAQKEYEKARDIVDDIVLSFDRELKREADRLELVANREEGNSSKADTSLKKVDIVEKKLLPLENQINEISHRNANILSGLTGLESKIKELEVSRGTLLSKIAAFEEQIQKFSVDSELKVEPVIQIKREKAMSALTDTEITVLEMLSSEGSKTAPETKDRVHLSREHTARLMKKLYEEGYLEREIGKIPFRYSIKREMGNILKKTETGQQS